MKPFQALLHSLLEHVVEYMQNDVDIQAVRVSGDEHTESAHIEIVLGKNTWEQQQRAIDHMIEIRAIFIGDLALDYMFVDAGDWVKSEDDASRGNHVYAA